ncbi:MAG: ABC transporter ATP-binding protein [Thermoprotei archaeon]
MDEIVVVKNLTKVYIRSTILGFSKSTFVAVDNISISFQRGKTTAIVGESGSGKTTLGECITMLIRPNKGSIIYKGNDIARLKGKELASARRGMQMVFQDPMGSLNPRMKIKDILKEPLLANANDLDNVVRDSLTTVGLPPEAAELYPYQFSGGQRQRIAIARAIINKPEFIVLDEPTSALDVSVQLQILNLLKSLQKRFEITYMFITHNLGVAKYMSHFIAVMFGGRIVEFGSAQDVIAKPVHPYTAALLSSVPSGSKNGFVYMEKTDDPTLPTSGCRYRLRCPFSTSKCLEEPQLVDIGDGRLARCHYPEKVSQAISS